ncbi:hypothetical protein CJ030_MR7G021972 [Morella rubra]|uniref:DUF8040 domain-containing protein n=1 Tax=Morella rubra TaxID=262757 RepID=A0A6A1V1M3_9ROSI|nr:hypothetical protein CJ030_MR7G021972 [Morella rubra]
MNPANASSSNPNGSNRRDDDSDDDLRERLMIANFFILDGRRRRHRRRLRMWPVGLSGADYIQQVLNNPNPTNCRWQFRVGPSVFQLLADTLLEEGRYQPTSGVTVEEALGMFMKGALEKVGHVVFGTFVVIGEYVNYWIQCLLCGKILFSDSPKESDPLRVFLLPLRKRCCYNKQTHCIVREGICREYGYTTGDLMYYVHPSKTLNDGLILLKSDIDVLEMVSYHTGHHLIILYVVGFREETNNIQVKKQRYKLAINKKGTMEKGKKMVEEAEEELQSPQLDSFFEKVVSGEDDVFEGGGDNTTSAYQSHGLCLLASF